MANWKGKISSVPTERGCLLWTGKIKNKRPQVKIDGKVCYVSRVLLSEKLERPIRSGMYALHTCDVEACCYPNHLYEGTPRQNVLDAVERGRWGQGGAPALLFEEVTYIRKMYAEIGHHWTRRRLATLFRVSQQTITQAVTGRTYKGAGGPISKPRSAAGVRT